MGKGRRGGLRRAALIFLVCIYMYHVPPTGVIGIHNLRGGGPSRPLVRN